MKVTIRMVGLIPCLVVVATMGCRRTAGIDERERNYRIVAKAYEMSSQGDDDSAVSLFRKALETYPKLARPHLDVALILHDRKQDYMRAIYHYTRYLELRPRTEKLAMIQERIRQAERAFAEVNAAEGSGSGMSVRELEVKNTALKAKNEALAARVVALEADLAAVREQERQRYKAEVVGEMSTVEAPVVVPPAPKPEMEPEDVRDSVAVIEATVVTPERAYPSPPVSPPVAKPSAPTNSVVRTYTVRPGDSLSKIAFKVYGDATKWRAIQNANRGSLRDSVIKVGQVLVVP
jgi:hypothetical protein